MSNKTNSLVSQLIDEFVEIVDACKTNNRSQTDVIAMMLMTCRAWKYADAFDVNIKRIDAILEKALVHVAIYSAKDMSAQRQMQNVIASIDDDWKLTYAVRRYFAK